MAEDASPTYGNWRRPRSFGIGKYGAAGMATFAAAAVGTMLLGSIVGWAAAGVYFAVMVAAAMGLTVPDRHGQSRGEKWAVRIGWWRQRRGRRNLYRSGPLGASLWGTCQLPGVLASTKLTEHTDGWGRRFAVLEMPRRGQFSVTFACKAQGQTLVDPETREEWVAAWAGFFELLAADGDVAAMSVTVETAPEGGQKLRERIAARIDPNAPAAARSAMQSIVDSYPQGAVKIGTWVTLTFRAQQAAKKRTVQEFAAELAPTLPSLAEQLDMSGVAESRPVSAQELCEITRGAYDPAAGLAIDAAHACGEEPQLRWQDCGPIAHQTNFDSYRHDGATSVTWAMTGAPRGLVRSHVLAALLAPNKAIDRKRVTLLYRILDLGQSAQIVEADLRNAQSRVAGSSRVSGEDKKSVRLVELMEREEANGATVVDFALLATATIVGGDPQRLAQAASVVERRGLASKLHLRRVYGSQDSAFAASLPLGLVLSDYMALPREFRGGL